MKSDFVKFFETEGCDSLDDERVGKKLFHEMHTTVLICKEFPDLGLNIGIPINKVSATNSVFFSLSFTFEMPF